jgi:LacI family transcriptional regulator
MREMRRAMERSRATLKEVAREVGVSICTASVVLNGSSSGSRISDGTRDAVIDAAQRLGYRANQVARSLHAGRTHMIGVVPAATDTNILLGPHLQHVLNGIVNETESHKYDLSLITRCDQSHPTDLLNALLGGKMDGVIVVAPRAQSRLLPLLREESLPMVVIDGDPEQCDNYFIVDNKQAVRIAIRHLVQLGHRKIAYIAGPQDLYAARVRKDAFFEVMKECGLEVNLQWLQVGLFSYQSGADGFNRILRGASMPTAIFCANDETAFGALDAATQAGLKVPEDLSVVGFDDVPLAQHSHPPLTTVRQPVDEIARVATASLLDNIDTGTPIRSRTFPAELIVRQSTGPCEQSRYC